MLRIILDGYSLAEEIKKLSEEDYAWMKKIFPSELDFEKPKDELRYISKQESVITEDEIEVIPDSILRLTSFKPIKRNRFIDLNEVSQNEIREKAMSVFQVHLPNNELLAIKEVGWIENACTEELQRKLNEGWRILAVCPQPSNRRPDYVLGRYPFIKEF